jgi:hypothetical protein
VTDPRAAAAERLDAAGVPHVRDGAFLRVPPEAPDGFEVWIGPGDAWQAGYEGWHAEFQDPEQALACFLMGLTDGVRLRVTRRGGQADQWAVETREGKTLGIVGRVGFAFWRRREVVVLQNRRPASALRPGARKS